MSYGAIAHLLAWVSVFVCAWLAPLTGDSLFRKLERVASRLASHRAVSCVAVGLFVLVVRATLLPWWPIPKPYIYDEFGYILQADTFASGRLTNPPHPLAPFFESIYILQSPTYNAKFPPGQGLMLSLGQMVFDQPWWGVWLSCGLLAAALCWALQGWLPPSWALLGAALALPLCISSYWMNSFWGGAVTAIGGALVVGAFPRLVPPHKRAAQGRHSSAWLLALGSVMLIYTRPFEGILFLLPVFVTLARKRLSVKDWSAILFLGALGAAWLGYYNYRVTGSPTRLPYIEYDRQYPSTPHVNVLPLPPPHQFDQLNFTLMDRWEREAWEKARTFRFPLARLTDVYQALAVFGGSLVLMLPLALFWKNLVQAPRLKLLWWCLGTGALAVAIGVQYYIHYAAPLLAVILILIAQALRHLRLFHYSGQPVGKFLVRALPATMLVLAAGHIVLLLYKPQKLEDLPPNVRMQRLEDALLERSAVGHVVFVRYVKYRFPQEEWIYNRADIDNAPVIWAQDRGPQENQRLIKYFKGRLFWLLTPDETGDLASPYPDDEAKPK